MQQFRAIYDGQNSGFRSKNSENTVNDMTVAAASFPTRRLQSSSQQHAISTSLFPYPMLPHCQINSTRNRCYDIRQYQPSYNEQINPQQRQQEQFIQNPLQQQFTYHRLQQIQQSTQNRYFQLQQLRQPRPFQQFAQEQQQLFHNQQRVAQLQNQQLLPPQLRSQSLPQQQSLQHLHGSTQCSPTLHTTGSSPVRKDVSEWVNIKIKEAAHLIENCKNALQNEELNLDVELVKFRREHANQENSSESYLREKNRITKKLFQLNKQKSALEEQTNKYQQLSSTLSIDTAKHTPDFVNSATATPMTLTPPLTPVDNFGRVDFSRKISNSSPIECKVKREVMDNKKNVTRISTTNKQQDVIDLTEEDEIDQHIEYYIDTEFTIDSIPMDLPDVGIEIGKDVQFQSAEFQRIMRKEIQQHTSDLGNNTTNIATECNDDSDSGVYNSAPNISQTSNVTDSITTETLTGKSSTTECSTVVSANSDNSIKEISSTDSSSSESVKTTDGSVSENIDSSSVEKSNSIENSLPNELSVNKSIKTDNELTSLSTQSDFLNYSKTTSVLESEYFEEQCSSKSSSYNVTSECCSIQRLAQKCDEKENSFTPLHQKQDKNSTVSQPLISATKSSTSPISGTRREPPHSKLTQSTRDRPTYLAKRSKAPSNIFSYDTDSECSDKSFPLKDEAPDSLTITSNIHSPSCRKAMLISKAVSKRKSNTNNENYKDSLTTSTENMNNEPEKKKYTSKRSKLPLGQMMEIGMKNLAKRKRELKKDRSKCKSISRSDLKMPLQQPIEEKQQQAESQTPFSNNEYINTSEVTTSQGVSKYNDSCENTTNIRDANEKSCSNKNKSVENKNNKNRPTQNKPTQRAPEDLPTLYKLGEKYKQNCTKDRRNVPTRPSVKQQTRKPFYQQSSSFIQKLFFTNSRDNKESKKLRHTKSEQEKQKSNTEDLFGGNFMTIFDDFYKGTERN